MRYFFYFLFIIFPCLGICEAKDFVTKDGFKNHCDWVYDNSDTLLVNDVKLGDTIFVNERCLNKFLTRHHPKINHAYILVTHGTTNNITEDYLQIIEDPKIIAWFAKNVQYKHKKLIPIPIGIQNKSWHKKHRFNPHYKNHSVISKCICNPAKTKKTKALAQFLIGTHKVGRQDVYQILKDKPFCVPSVKKWPYKQYLKRMQNYQFVISPPGIGFDCYRTWECLLLDTIPVTLSSPMDPLFDDLPVILVKNWEEVTLDLLKDKLEEFSNKEFNLEKLYINYWTDLIESYRKEFLSNQQDF